MLTDIFKRNVTIERTGSGSYVNYIWVEGASSNLIIRANVQPTPAEVLETLPEGYRNKDSYTLFTNTHLFTSVDNNSNPDVVLLYNRRYIVAKVAIWENTSLSHYEIIVVEDESDRN